jgi:hypothetical protein
MKPRGHAYGAGQAIAGWGHGPGRDPGGKGVSGLQAVHRGIDAADDGDAQGHAEFAACLGQRRRRSAFLRRGRADDQVGAQDPGRGHADEDDDDARHRDREAGRDLDLS